VIRNAVAIFLTTLVSTAALAAEPKPVTLQVKASAYNSAPERANTRPALGAWGDRLKPGMKVIAVSEDLLADGLEYGAEVRIQGLSDRYVVMDRMHPRWERKIDIYMGDDRNAALRWGVRDVKIIYTPSRPGI